MLLLTSSLTSANGGELLSSVLLLYLYLSDSTKVRATSSSKLLTEFKVCEIETEDLECRSALLLSLIILSVNLR